MLSRTVVPTTILLLLGLAAPAEGRIKLRYSTTASFADGTFATHNPMDNILPAGVGDYSLKATVTLRRRKGKSWTGKGRLRWRSSFYHGQECATVPNVRFSGERSSTFRVKAKLRFRRRLLKRAELVVRSGFPAVRVEREFQYGSAGCAPKRYWNGHNGPIVSPPGWHAIFELRHYLHELGPNNDRGECYEPNRSLCGNQDPADARYVIRGWHYHSSGAVLATKRYPEADVSLAPAVRRKFADKWKLVRTSRR